MKRLTILALFTIALTSCSKSMRPFETLDEARSYISEVDETAEAFELQISDTMQDPMGGNMAILLDGILGKGFEPDGFEQQDGYRIYRYKKTK